MFNALTGSTGALGTASIESSHVKAHRSAAGGKGAPSSRRSALARRPHEHGPDLGLQGVIRGNPNRTTVQDKAAPCPLEPDLPCPAPNRLWLSDFTYVSTWPGYVDVAFVIEARRIVRRRLSRMAHASFVFDALVQAPRSTARPSRRAYS
jgi:transposase InsO family protein